MAGLETELCGCLSESTAPCLGWWVQGFPNEGKLLLLLYYLLPKKKSRLHWYFLMLSHKSANQAVLGMPNGDVAWRDSCAVNLQTQ